jgi:tetratricopeptide (TPR) repeat protein
MDPAFHDAQVMLANVANNALTAASSDRSDEILRVMQDAVDRSIALAPNAPSVLCVRGMQERLAGRLVEAGRLFEEAALKAPNDSVVLQSQGVFLGEVGRLRDAIVVLRQWARVEPLYVQPTYIVGLVSEAAGKLEQAEEQYRLASRLEGNPNAFAGPELVVALTRGDRPAIDELLERVLENDLGFAGHAEITAAMRDNLDNSDAALAVLRRHLQESQGLGALMKSVIGVWAAWFGDDDLALAAFRDIRDMPATFIWVVMWRPLCRGMRQLPGFKVLLRELGLVDYCRQTGHWGDYVRPVGEDDFEVIG